MRILVTGGAGFIGSFVTETLLSQGHEVAIIDNLRTGSLDNLAVVRADSHLQVHVADVLEPGRLDRLCREFSPAVLIHLAALVSVQDARQSPDLNFQLNVEATHRVATAAVASGVSRLIFASSAAIYGDNPRIPLAETELPAPIGHYGGAKAASELLLSAIARDAGFDAVLLRFFNVFGPRQRPDSPYSGVISIFADRVRTGRGVTIFGDGSQTRDFVPVRQVATAVAAAAEAPKGLTGPFNVCTGVRTSLRQLVAGFETAAGRPVPASFQPARAGDIVHSGGNPHALEAATGFRPKVNLVEALGELLVG